MMRWRLPLFIIAAVITLLFLNGIVWRHEQTLAQGHAVLLPLRPVDPRSLMQGDYMALDYQLTQQLTHDLMAAPPAAGQALAIVLGTDSDGVAQFLRMAKPGEQLPAGETLVRLKWEDNGAHLPSNSYFFAEGEATRFTQARYAIFRVASDGTALLAGLADERHNTIPDRIKAPTSARSNP
ncbi:GDYXXLXY domain-containing protein [Collimonas pratensis]|uniref:GDYXXLXY family protein n=1 Tax=Collimonas pratensis TaxID=279113 RepID=A0ABM5Z581_9BURK|nr:GDYXXLXY domain-containing protein [Collimonas pratensis]AMP14230.1 GDYXXLXY family protein [Collimonas pratensis]